MVIALPLVSIQPAMLFSSGTGKSSSSLRLMLVEAAKRLKESIRDGDTVGRLGGDEFIVLLGGLKQAKDATPVVRNLVERFRRPFVVGKREFLLTTSVGISIYPQDGELASELLRNADSAMYHSKKLGRNTFSYFTDSMNKGVARRLVLEEKLHGALERNEFHVVYQPKVAVNSREMIGVEALLRWNNTELGEVSPEEFIPLAEQTGMIVPIGQFVLDDALGRAADWAQLTDRPFSIAINLSPRQFREPQLLQQLQASLNTFDVDPGIIELEITEGVLMSGLPLIENAVQAISDLGATIAMDDFGTGYSSLSYLRSYPFNVLKIDRSFINDITVDVTDRELVNAAIAMAHGLGLKVVAEGVETEEQLQMLLEQRCDFAQGYLFSKPARAEQISAMLEQTNTERPETVEG